MADTVLDGLNRYTYVANNPLRFTDPTGHFWSEELANSDDSWSCGKTAFDNCSGGGGGSGSGSGDKGIVDGLVDGFLSTPRAVVDAVSNPRDTVTAIVSAQVDCYTSSFDSFTMALSSNGVSCMVEATVTETLAIADAHGWDYAASHMAGAAAFDALVLRSAGAALRAGRQGSRAATAARYCSFSAATEVLMADGTTKPISQVKVGDFVLAEDPETGERGAREVIASLPHTDLLVVLRTGSGEIVTTEDHHFWNATDQQWQESQDFDRGDQLLTSDGGHVRIEGIDWSTVHMAPAYDLDVAGIDTYYVAAGSNEVLVHNCNGAPRALPAFSRSSIDDAVTSVSRRHNDQISVGARAIDKRLGDNSAPFQGIEATTANAQAIVTDILESPTHTVFGQRTYDVYNAAGQGARFDVSSNRFITFLDETIATR